MSRKTLLTVCAVLFYSFLVRAAAFADTQGLNLELEVFQALREGVKGTAFVDEYTRIGLPFPQGMVKEQKGRASVAVVGKEYQSRVLKRWPDGSVKWAVVEFLASPGNGKSERVRLVAGSGVSNGTAMAREDKGRVYVDTGPLHVEIKKTDFTVFDKVSVDGHEVIQPGKTRGIVLTDGNGKEFLASQCGDTRVTIEENGPVKATIRVDGAHCNKREKLLDYTMRLFFFKGKNSVKAQYTLRNAGKKYAKHAFIKTLNLETALSLQDGKKVVVSTHKGMEELDLQKGGVKLYQAVSDFPWMEDGDSFYYHGPVPSDNNRESSRRYKQEGYWLWQEGTLLLEGKRNQFPDLGFIDVSDTKGVGMTAGIRYMAGQWPKTLKARNDGTLAVSLWPEENGQGYWIRYGSHTTFEIIYAFHGNNTVKPDEEMKRFQYPLVTRGPVEWYNRNVEGIYPLYHFITFGEEKKLAAKIGAQYEVGWRKPKFKVWRYHYWGHGGFLNQHDFARIGLVNFLRDDRSLTKAGEFALSAEAMFNYYADWAVYHSDDYDYAREQFDPQENKKDADLAKVVFEWEHQHWYGMPLYYYMTGDERVREAVVDWGEYVKKLANPLNLHHMRVFGTGMFSLAAMYEFTGDKEYLRLADMNFKRLLDSHPKDPYAGISIDWERGYVGGGSGSGWNDTNPAIKADIMLGSLLYDGLFNYYSFQNSGNALRSDTRKLLMKLSDFMYKEPYFEGTKRNHWAYWIAYEYCLTNREKSKHDYRLIGQASFWTVFPFDETKEEKWLDRMAKMMKMAMWDEDGVWGSFSYMDHPGYQTMAYYLLNNKLSH